MTSLSECCSDGAEFRDIRWNSHVLTSGEVAVGVTVTVVRELMSIKCSGWEAYVRFGGFDCETEVLAHFEIVGESAK